MAVKIQSLKIEYPEVLLFEDVSLEVSDHEIIAIRTEVLDGGTSLLKGIAGFLNGVEGEVLFEGHNLLHPVPDSIRNLIGFVYESHGLVSIYSVFQNICLPLHFHTDFDNTAINNEVVKVCEKLGIPESQYHLRPHHLNDVQTRMVNLARALVVKPRLLLIDELEGGMSDEYLQDTMLALRDFQAEHPMAIIITTANEYVMESSDRVYNISEKNLIAA